MNIARALALFSAGLFMAGIFWLFCRASVMLGWEAIRGLLKDPPFALIIAGGLVAIAMWLFDYITWLLARL